MNLDNHSAGFLYKMKQFKLYQNEKERGLGFRWLLLLIRYDFGLKKGKGEEKKRQVFLNAFKKLAPQK